MKLCRLLVPTVALLLVGCGGGPDLSDVAGTVKLDGQPLADAEVEFQPASGSPSVGRTDAAGHYELAFAPDEPGAIAGQHTVRITTYRRDPEPGSTQVTPELVPAKYNAESTLKVTVPSADGAYDFDLSSK